MSVPFLGVVPPDVSSPVGELRVLLGDVVWEPLPEPDDEPVDPGVPEPEPEVFGVGEPDDEPELEYGVYKDYSDVELEFFYGSAGTVEGAMALIYAQMAGAAAREAQSVQDFDLRLDTTRRADKLLAMSREWQARADALGDDFFEVFSPEPAGRVRPELAPGVFGGGFFF